MNMYTEFIRFIADLDDDIDIDINGEYDMEMYISLEGWDVPYYMPKGYSFKRYDDYVCLYKGDVRVCRFDKNEDVARRMIGADVERMRGLVNMR